MSTYSPEQLAEQLKRVQERKKVLAGNNPNSPVASRDYRDGAAQFNEFAPQVMDTRIIENPFSEQIAQTVGRTSTQATAASGVQAQNRFDWQQWQAEQRRLKQAQRNQVKPTKDKIKPPKALNVPQVQGTPDGMGGMIHTTTPGSPGSTTGGPATGSGSSYYTQSPEWLDINAPLTTFKAGGHSWTLNSSVAGRFKGFINALTATGYVIKSAGSYANRNQANGSGNRSLHSYGLAIDINAFQHGNSYNPGNAGVHQTNLPKGVSALAAKYGLVWGGDWKNSKDYMHFSVPYAGLLKQQGVKPPKNNPNQAPGVQNYG
jgi:hypothetical protein